MGHILYRIATTCACGFVLLFNSGLCFAQKPSQAEASQAPPRVGDTAPDFTLQDQDEKQVSLHDFRGKNVVVVFYIFSFSPLASQELSALKREAEKWEGKAQLLAVSVDSIPVNRAFADSLGLNFPLLSDGEMKVGSEYGVYSDKRPGVSQETYKRLLATWLVDPEGKVQVEEKGEGVLNLALLSERLKVVPPK